MNKRILFIIVGVLLIAAITFTSLFLFRSGAESKFTKLYPKISSNKNSEGILVYDTGVFAGLTDEQKNSIAMLNYITVLSTDIASSYSNKLYVEKAYSDIVNNIMPNAVDKGTLSILMNTLNTIETYRMIESRRDIITYRYDTDKGNLIFSSIGKAFNEKGSTNMNGFSKGELAMKLVTVVTKSVTAYFADNRSLDITNTEETMKLNNEQKANLNKMRSNVFAYMVNSVHDYGIPGKLALTEESVKEFIEWKNNPNVEGRIQFLVSNMDTYVAYEGYWLLLAESYYEVGKYRKCIEAVDACRSMNISIFRRDYDYARVLPLAIAAAAHTMKDGDYVNYAAKCAQEILNNTNSVQWELRYFAACTFVEIYNESKNKEYLTKAYDIAVDNVNYLALEQHRMNDEFIHPVQDVVAGVGASKAEKEGIELYNNMRKMVRKTELPPVYEPLVVNCELMYDLSKLLNVSDNEISRIRSIIYGTHEMVFLCSPLEAMVADGCNDWTAVLPRIELTENEICIPMEYLTNDSIVKITVTNVDDEYSLFYDGSVKNEYISSFYITPITRKPNIDIASQKVKFIHYLTDVINDGDIITMEIINGASHIVPNIVVKWTVKITKRPTILLKDIIEFIQE